MPLGIIYW